MNPRIELQYLRRYNYTISDADFEKTQTLDGLNQNSFCRWFAYRFGPEAARAVFDQYFVGTWKRRVVFWQIDENWGVRTGQAIRYGDSFAVENIRRDKTQNAAPLWMHKVFEQENFILNQCFFGQHLLAARSLPPLAFVESAKTALVCSLYYPEYVWLATFGAGGLSVERMEPFRGRKIWLFPDLGVTDVWEAKAKTLRAARFNIEIDDTLENLATPADRAAGLDLADILLRGQTPYEAERATPPKTGHTSPTTVETSAGGMETHPKENDGLKPIETPTQTERGPHVNAEIRAAAAEAYYKEGKTIAYITAKLGVSRTTVCKYLRKRNVR